MAEYNEKLWTKPSEKFKALGHPIRLWIAFQMLEGEHKVSDFVAPTGLDFSTISQHLAVLKRYGVVEAQKRGKEVFYSLVCPCVCDFLKCVSANKAKKESSDKKSK